MHGHHRSNFTISYCELLALCNPDLFDARGVMKNRALELGFRLWGSLRRKRQQKRSRALSSDRLVAILHMRPACVKVQGIWGSLRRKMDGTFASELRFLVEKLTAGKGGGACGGAFSCAQLFHK